MKAMTAKMKRRCFYAMVIYIIISIAFYYIGGDQLRYRTEVQSSGVTATDTVGELVSGTTVTQSFVMQSDILERVSILAANYDAPKQGIVKVRLLLDDGSCLYEADLDASTIVNNDMWTVFDGKLYGLQGKRIVIELSAPHAEPGEAITFWTGNTVSGGKVELQKEILPAEAVCINGENQTRQLCYTVYGENELLFGQYYWIFAVVVGVILFVYILHLQYTWSRGKSNLLLRAIVGLRKYKFLLSQLVIRDFKTKYKRSVLGILWSFLNPLLTMLVQYLVFSTIFSTDIPNFVIYLLTGIVCYNFFNEALSLGLTSIVSNASLITKVYMPKYMYPFSRVLSSSVNFMLSLIPLFLMLFITRTPITSSILLLPFPIVSLLLLCIGMALLLCTLMVFFRDTQFLWGVVSMLWMYATPIFYPETIIPEHLMFIYKMNPLYHVIRFMRTILIDGVSPEPKAYLLCFLACLIPFIIGSMVFKRNQDKFILYI